MREGDLPGSEEEKELKSLCKTNASGVWGKRRAEEETSEHFM